MIGAERWSFSTSDEVYSCPAIGGDGTIYVGSYDDKLYVIGVKVPSAPQNLQANGRLTVTIHFGIYLIIDTTVIITAGRITME